MSEKGIFSPYLAKEYPDEEAFKESSETSKVNLEMALKRETAQNGLSNKELWQELSINDLGKFREVYMDYGRNGTPDYPRYLWQNSVDTWQWGSKVTIALSGGTALATKVHWVRRAWAMAEVVGAVGNIAVNTTNVSPEMKQVVDIYNLAMGVIGLKNIGQGGYEFARKLPEQTKKLLQESKSLRSELVARYLEWKTATTKLDNLTDAEKQLVAQQETVWKMLLGILPESTYLYNPNMAESVRNAITRSGVSMEKFVNTNYKASHGMASAEEIAWLQDIVTKYFPKPEKEERLRKVITIETMEKWQLGKNNPNFKGASLLKNGFLTKSKDYITPRSTEELIENLRLDYKNSSFSKNEGFVVIEFKSDDAFKIDHAFNTSQNNNPLPYTKTGMTGSKRNIIPEYVNQNDITFKGGETMTVYDNKGNIVSKYEYKYDKIKDEGKWEKE